MKAAAQVPNSSLVVENTFIDGKTLFSHVAPRSLMHFGGTGAPNFQADPMYIETKVAVQEFRTTVMFSSLPQGFGRQSVEELLDNNGFARCYDFIYVPTDMNSGSTFFYAFINLVTPKDALRFHRHFAGFTRWPKPSSQVAQVLWSGAEQGLGPLVDRFRNCPLMHESVPGHLRPTLYRAGKPTEFPAPTKRIKAPRLRHREKPRQPRASLNVPRTEGYLDLLD